MSREALFIRSPQSLGGANSVALQTPRTTGPVVYSVLVCQSLVVAGPSCEEFDCITAPLDLTDPCWSAGRPAWSSAVARFPCSEEQQLGLAL
jgi:hypothetical protein